jgi:tetratricopeptide (TPR) repeat protein
MAERVSSPTFVGRAEELRRLEVALERAGAGEPAIVLLGGEAGVGKTRLVAELAARAEKAGARVLVGGCIELGDGALPYAPIVEALRPLARTLDPASLRSLAGPAHGELAGLLPELGDGQPGPADPQGMAGHGQARLFELLLGMLDRLGQERPLLLVVEDLHWADRSTRDLLAFLVRNLRAERILLVATYRSDELHRRHPLRPSLAELARSGRVERVELEPFGRQELATLLEGILGAPPDGATVDDVLDRSEGNPFFAEELVAAAAHRAGSMLPPSLRDILLIRFEALSDQAQAVLRVAAVAGRRVQHELLAQVAGMAEPALLEGLRNAVAHQVLVVDPDGGSYAFRHALVQEAVYAEALPGERNRLHLALATALEARPELAAGPAAAAEIASHWDAANDQPRALAASVRAGLQALSGYAFAEAQRHLERALELWEQVADAAERAGLGHLSLLQHASDAAGLAGDHARAAALVRAALAEVNEAADPSRAGVLHERLGRHLSQTGQPGALEAYQTAVHLVPAEPPSTHRARVLAGLARMQMLATRFDEAMATAEEAIGVASQTGGRGAEAGARTTLGVTLTVRGDLGRGIGELEAAKRIAEQVGDPEELARAYTNLSDALLTAGRFEEAASLGLEGAEQVRRLGLGGFYVAFPAGSAAEALFRLGRWDEAERQVREALRGDPGLSGANLLVQAAELETARGDLDAATGTLRAARQAGRTVMPARGSTQVATQLFAPLLRVTAELAWWRGHPEEARHAIRDGLRVVAGSSDPRNLSALVLIGLRVEAEEAQRASARRADGEAEQARRAAQRLIEQVRAALRATGDGRRPLPVVLAEAATAEAELARAEGSGDAGLWERAVGHWEALRQPYPEAYASWRAAEALAADPSRRPDAERLARGAFRLAAELGARPLREEVEALARRARLRLEDEQGAHAVPAPPPSPGAELGLTPASGRCWRWSPRDAPTGRSPRRCSSAPRRPACTSPTSWESSPSPTGSRPPRSPTASASSTTRPRSALRRPRPRAVGRERWGAMAERSRELVTNGPGRGTPSGGCFPRRPAGREGSRPRAARPGRIRSRSSRMDGPGGDAYRDATRPHGGPPLMGAPDSRSVGRRSS